MDTTTNQRASSCRLCGAHVPAKAGLLWWCEDGSPIHCDRHFDEGGWEVSCADTRACRRRQAENHREAAAAKVAKDAAAAAEDAAHQAKLDAWGALRDRHLAPFPASTRFGPSAFLRGRDEWRLRDGTPLELVAEAYLDDSRYPLAPASRPALYRAPSIAALVLIDRARGGQTWHVADQDAADALCRLYLAETPCTREVAAAGLDSPHIQPDHRRMYEIVLADA